MVIKLNSKENMKQWCFREPLNNLCQPPETMAIAVS